MRRNTLLASLLTPGLKKFSNRHKGESCYIFGDGPSIKWFDLRRFGDRPGICCGMIPFHREFPSLDIRYLALVAPLMFAPKLLQPSVYHPYRAIASEYARLIPRLPDREFFVNWSNRLFLSGKNVNYVFRGLPRNDSKTDDMLAMRDLFSGSFHATLALAYFLGFSRVYMIGFDAWTLQPARTRRWYERGPGDTFVDGTGAASVFLKVLEREMEIFAVTLEGRIDSIAGVSYEQLTGVAPRYRENDELMEQSLLQIMATYPGHVVL